MSLNCKVWLGLDCRFACQERLKTMCTWTVLYPQQEETKLNVVQPHHLSDVGWCYLASCTYVKAITLLKADKL